MHCNLVKYACCVDKQFWRFGVDWLGQSNRKNPTWANFILNRSSVISTYIAAKRQKNKPNTSNETNKPTNIPKQSQQRKLTNISIPMMFHSLWSAFEPLPKVFFSFVSYPRCGCCWRWLGQHSPWLGLDIDRILGGFFSSQSFGKIYRHLGTPPTQMPFPFVGNLWS